MKLGDNGPFDHWIDDSEEDFRTNPSQVESFVRNTLNNEAYLTNTHRVNMGSKYIKRAMEAENMNQKPITSFSNSDRWGHSSWLNNRALKAINKKSNLYTDNNPYNPLHKPCQTCRRFRSPW